MVSPEGHPNNCEALEDQIDVESAAEARKEDGSISHRDLMAELGL
ncbi:hypothetical protein [Brachybacterium sp. NPDC056505]